MRLIKKVRHVLFADAFVTEHRAADEHRNQRGIALIAIAAFIVMSFLNIKQDSFMMLATTSISAVFLAIGYLLSKYKKITAFLRIIFYIIFIVIFTSYTILGGNDGFAALWLVIATYAVMIAIDFKAGFLISCYYLIMLLLVFNGPCAFLLQFDYNQTFVLRFPFLYAINFAFATYIIIRIRLYQYELLLKQQELEYLSTIDLSTGLMNRNNFIQLEEKFSYDSIQNLMAIFIDVNGLHEINNRLGHDAGDQMLKAIAQLCKDYFSDDLIYRMGGDEFLIICQNIDTAYKQEVVKQLFASVTDLSYSISYGIEIQATHFDLNELVKFADEKMIQFKKEYYQATGRKKR